MREHLQTLARTLRGHSLLAEFTLETNYPKKDNSSKYKFGAKTNYEAKFRLLARLEDVLTDG